MIWLILTLILLISTNRIVHWYQPLILTFIFMVDIWYCPLMLSPHVPNPRTFLLRRRSSDPGRHRPVNAPIAQRPLALPRERNGFNLEYVFYVYIYNIYIYTLDIRTISLKHIKMTNPLVNSHSYWTCPVMVDLPTNNFDIPYMDTFW